MSSSRSFIPRPGNAARPVFFVIAGFFGIMLVGYPVFMYTVGLGTGSIVWITLLIAVIAVGALWFTSYYGRSLQRDEARLDAGEVWAEWTVPEWQHRRFLEAERSSTNRMAILLALGGTALGLVLAWPAQDWLLAGIMTGSFLLAAGVTFFLGGPPRSAHGDDARHVRIGPSGVHLLGRYIPFEATMTRLRAVNISDGDPPVMTLSVHAGRRIDQIRVPIAPDRVEQAEAVAERLRREHNLWADRIACVLLDGEDREMHDDWAAHAFTVVGVTASFLVYVSGTNPLLQHHVEDAAGIFVVGGLTPAYHEAIVPSAASWLPAHVQRGVPYAGISAGAMIPADRAVVGGWKLRQGSTDLVICSEELAKETEHIGGLVPFAVDAHASQYGSPTRDMHAADAGLLDEGWTIDEETMIELIDGVPQVRGPGVAYRIGRRARSLEVDIAGDDGAHWPNQPTCGVTQHSATG